MYTSVKSIFAQPEKYLGGQVTVKGWVRTVRDSKQFGFIELNDGGCFKNIQVVLIRETLDNYDRCVRLGVGSAISVTGLLEATPEARQPFEIKAEQVTVEGESAPDYPLQKKRHTMEFLRTLPHLRQRTNTLSAVFRIRSLAAFALHRFFNENGFVYVHTPIITGSDCEGAGEMFQVTTLPMEDIPKAEGGVDYSQDFFGHKVGLTVSGQLMGEAYALAFKNIYTFGPTFRAENSNTARHAAEFWMIEPEMAFCDIQGDMATAENMIKYVISYCMEQAPDELEFFSKFIDNGLLDRLRNVVDTEHFKRISYTEAIDLLKNSGRKFDYPVEWGGDIATEHERYITEEVFGCPVFVTDYPKDIKAFYMKQNADGRTVAAMDLLVPGIGEIIGGSERETDFEKLTARMKELGMELEGYKWYTDLRRYGGVAHSGYGLGFERLIMYLTGIQNIRDVLPFPRTAGSAEL